MSADTERRPKGYIVHPKYNNIKIDYDIALLELETPIKYTMSIRPACIHNMSFINDNFLNHTHITGRLTGCGVNDVYSRSQTEFLQVSMSKSQLATPKSIYSIYIEVLQVSMSKSQLATPKSIYSIYTISAATMTMKLVKNTKCDKYIYNIVLHWQQHNQSFLLEFRFLVVNNLKS